MRENQYQTKLIRKLRTMFPGCIILKNDSGYAQGIPDLTVLYEDKWAVLEVKASRETSTRPNQDFYIERLSRMSFAAFIYPAIEEEVLDALQQALRPRRAARVSQRQ